jgi:hypothetical protein
VAVVAGAGAAVDEPLLTVLEPASAARGAASGGAVNARTRQTIQKFDRAKDMML